MKAVKLLNELRSFALPDDLRVKIVHRKDGVDQHYHIKPHQDPTTTLQNLRDQKELDQWKQNPTANLIEPQDRQAARLVVDMQKDAGGGFQWGDWKNPASQGTIKVSTVKDPQTLHGLQQKLDSTAGQHSFRLELQGAYDVDYPDPIFDQKAQELGNVQSLWHGVGNQRAAGLLATSFKTPKEVGSVTGQMFGPGVYFTDVSTKAGQYIGGQQAFRNKGNMDGYLLETDVILGKQYEAIDSGDIPPWAHLTDREKDRFELYQEQEDKAREVNQHIQAYNQLRDNPTSLEALRAYTPTVTYGKLSHYVTPLEDGFNINEDPPTQRHIEAKDNLFGSLNVPNKVRKLNQSLLDDLVEDNRKRDPRYTRKALFDEVLTDTAQELKKISLGGYLEGAKDFSKPYRDGLGPAQLAMEHFGEDGLQKAYEDSLDEIREAGELEHPYGGIPARNEYMYDNGNVAGGTIPSDASSGVEYPVVMMMRSTVTAKMRRKLRLPDPAEFSGNYELYDTLPSRGDFAGIDNLRRNFRDRKEMDYSYDHQSGGYTTGTDEDAKHLMSQGIETLLSNLLLEPQGISRDNPVNEAWQKHVDRAYERGLKTPVAQEKMRDILESYNPNKVPLMKEPSPKLKAEIDEINRKNRPYDSLIARPDTPGRSFRLQYPEMVVYDKHQAKIKRILHVKRVPKVED